MTEYPLSKGAKQLYYSIRSRYPDLEDQKVRQIGNIVLDEVSRRIGSGDSLAFFRLSPEGQAEVITYSLERARDRS